MRWLVMLSIVIQLCSVSTSRVIKACQRFPQLPKSVRETQLSKARRRIDGDEILYMDASSSDDEIDEETYPITEPLTGGSPDNLTPLNLHKLDENDITYACAPAKDTAMSSVVETREQNKNPPTVHSSDAVQTQPSILPNEDDATVKQHPIYNRRPSRWARCFPCLRRTRETTAERLTRLAGASRASNLNQALPTSSLSNATCEDYGGYEKIDHNDIYESTNTESDQEFLNHQPNDLSSTPRPDNSRTLDEHDTSNDDVYEDIDTSYAITESANGMTGRELLKHSVHDEFDNMVTPHFSNTLHQQHNGGLDDANVCTVVNAASCIDSHWRSSTWLARQTRPLPKIPQHSYTTVHQNQNEDLHNINFYKTVIDAAHPVDSFSGQLRFQAKQNQPLPRIPSLSPNTVDHKQNGDLNDAQVFTITVNEAYQADSFSRYYDEDGIPIQCNALLYDADKEELYTKPFDDDSVMWPRPLLKRSLHFSDLLNQMCHHYEKLRNGDGIASEATGTKGIATFSRGTPSRMAKGPTKGLKTSLTVGDRHLLHENVKYHGWNIEETPSYDTDSAEQSDCYPRRRVLSTIYEDDEERSNSDLERL